MLHEGLKWVFFSYILTEKNTTFENNSQLREDIKSQKFASINTEISEKKWSSES